jgi:hypothetical protein
MDRYNFDFNLLDSYGRVFTTVFALIALTFFAVLSGVERGSLVTEVGVMRIMMRVRI